MMHWQNLDRQGKIDAIRTVWRDGMSAAQIAAHFHGATRNAIVGMYDRWGDRLEGHPLRPATVQPNVVRVPRAPRRRAKPRATVPAKIFKAKPKPAFAEEQQLAGVPMMMLGPRQCKWPVNEAEIGELHLFCGLEADGSFCAHHHSRAFRKHLDRET